MSTNNRTMSNEEVARRTAMFRKPPVIKNIAKCDNIHEEMMEAGRDLKLYKDKGCPALKDNEECKEILQKIMAVRAKQLPAEYEKLGCEEYKRKGWFTPLKLEKNMNLREVNINALQNIMKKVLGNAKNPELSGVNFPHKGGKKTRRSTKRRTRKSTRKH